MDSSIIRKKNLLFNAEVNPCGNICQPLSEYCFLTDSDELVIHRANEIINQSTDKQAAFGLAQVICRTLTEVLNTRADIYEYKENAEFWKSVSENLTKDTLTGLLSGKGLGAFLDEMYNPEVIEPLIKKRYIARITYVDVNDLKKHNAGPGGHDQGDLAIATVGRALDHFVNSGRRKNRDIELSGGKDRRDPVQIPRNIAARSNDRGDEFIIISFKPNSNHRSLEQAKNNLEMHLNDLHYYYDGKEWPVTVTFGIGEAIIPKTLTLLKILMNRIDTGMMDLKKHSKEKNKTLGVIVNGKNA